MTDIPGDAADEMRELQEQFARRLPERVAEIEEAWQAALGAGWEAGRLRQLFRLAHSLRGAAATFGFADAAAIASRLESLLQEVTASGGPPDEEIARRIAGLVDELRSQAPSQDGRGNR
ncbi:MAG TPA: Hpt domain-containing protein [Thermoanaerobaculia bacterium]|nr:Hpt domain-containing protein [Thermoanaerobaculia bacterium]